MQGQGRTNNVIALTAPERWLSKRDLAEHFRFSPRWVERRMAEGMPSRLIGGQRRFLLTDVEA